VLQQFRQDDSVYQQILSSAVEVNSGEILMPRLSGRQQHRNNVPATSAEEYFKLAVFLPFIDTVMTSYNRQCLLRILQFFLILRINSGPTVICISITISWQMMKVILKMCLFSVFNIFIFYKCIYSCINDLIKFLLKFLLN